MATIQEALAAAVRHHQSGQISAAARIYRRIIEIAPDQTDALHLMGLVVRRAGQAGAAMRLLSRALRLDPAMAEPRLNLGNMLRDHGHGAAAAAYRSAIALRPELTVAYESLGALHRGQGRSAEAERAYRRAIRLTPMAAEGHNGLANVLQERDGLDGAIASYRRGLAIEPAHTAACNNMGIALRGLHRPVEAMACHRRAVALDPHFAAGQTSLGLALQEQGHLEEAARAHARAVAIDPAFAGGHANHGNARLNQNRLDEAVAGFRRAVAIDPAGPDARRNLGMALLVAGRFEEGWREYEWRLRCKDAPTHAAMPKPRWMGEPLDGRRILLHGEQGLGDALQFCRYVPLVAARGGRVILGLPAPLKRVMAGLPGVERFVSGQLPTDAFDLHLPMLSLGEVFGTQMDTIPHRVPYLTAEPDLVARWGERLKGLRGLKVGIVWAGSPTHGNDRNRSIGLAPFARLAAIPGVSLVSIQKGPTEGQAANPPGGFPLLNLSPDIRDFADTAAIMAGLDLVVCVDTSVAHLAGALGVPVWVMVPFAPDWRWMLDREDSPWYPTMRLFRQDRPGSWDNALDRLERALRGNAAQSTHTRTGPSDMPILAPVSWGELLDKITILDIKAERIADADKLANVRREREALVAVAAQANTARPEVAALIDDLRAVNTTLWMVEDEIRDCERAKDFGPRFVELARQVYHTNDRRAALKRDLNRLLGSELVEEKSYQAY
ncbi:tetratricopeptide repeat protein [Azospirillum sp. BE72]|uniref:tetratricopeptide repeat protein n=1 Tax=Azospirillum sp. BE72 TaxID=2817776 RepID=UPI00285B80A8|nr:tetratricopeptide repeat protein [Azospirillum sp. BE72]MDR6774053.1 tetratricopeptide (TPR) repeat protein [Azospirillum sp. BE72]